MELNPRDPAHWPFIGSVVDHVDGKRRPAKVAGRSRSFPEIVVLPWAFSSQRIGEVARAGPYGGFLGQAFDPICTEFSGKGTKTARKTLTTNVWEDLEPYRGITPESRFQLSAVTQLAAELTLDRLDTRLSLLEQIEQFRRRADAAASRTGIDRHRSMAFDLLRSGKARRAFDLGEESEETRSLYGMTLFGQAALTARRLVEAGGRFVTVFWDEFGLAGTGWDTHWDHFPRMKDELLTGPGQHALGPVGRPRSAAACSMKRSWSCCPSTGGRPSWRRSRGAAATTGRAAIRLSWPAAAWRVETLSAAQTRSRATRSSGRSRPKTSSPRSTTYWVLTPVPPSPIFKAGRW